MKKTEEKKKKTRNRKKIKNPKEIILTAREKERSLKRRAKNVSK